MSGRSHPAILTACWLGLVLGLALAVSQGRVGRVSEDALPSAYPARVGEHVVHSVGEARFRIEAERPGGTVRIEQAGVVRQVPVHAARPPIHLAISILSGLAFWLACLLAFAGRTEGEPGRSFFWGSFFYGLAIFAGAADAVGPPWLPNLARPVIRLIALALAPVMLVRIALLFPRRSPDFERLHAGRWLSAAAWVMGVASVVAYLAAVLAPGASTFARWHVVERAGQAYLLALVVIGMVQLGRNTRAAELARERQQAKWIWWGVVFGALPFALLHALPRALGLAPPVPIEVLRVVTIVIPVSFAIAVVRYQFMDIDVIIRRSLIYGSIAAILALVYLSAGLVLGRIFEPRGGPTSQVLGLVAAALAVALFTPTRDLVRRAVDRTFFRLRTDLDRAARELQRELPAAVDADDLARRIEAFLRSTLEPKALGVALGRGGAGELGAVAAAWSAKAFGPAGLAPRASHDRTSRPDLELEGLPLEVAAAGVVLVQPIPDATGRAPVGAILLGEKRSERRWVDEELVLLDSVAREAGRAFERVELARLAAEEAFAHARQVEIDRMKSRFLSQVAHDLRTPLTSILWSSQNLLDGVCGPLSESGSENARSIKFAAGHLSGLVTNLLEIAQLEGGRSAAKLQPIDARAVVGQAILVLRPVAAARRITLVFDGDTNERNGPPAVAADGEGLTKVVLNLVDNAIKFSPEGSSVEIALEREGDGAVALRVRDRGPGVPAGERERIFGSYERGSAAAEIGVPGFGLGLSVVRAWVERFGGEARVEDAAGGGAVFVCRLRPWAAATREA